MAKLTHKLADNCTAEVHKCLTRFIGIKSLTNEKINIGIKAIMALDAKQTTENSA
ncbi:hypothetical protein N894_0194 [Francisella tularensis subsp. novicida PA10-7858]|nr:hypothetical protein N894_0194 [Francisella tularensis subsp. novicida PA10-7858]